jgi:hypothetical protein
LATTYKAAAKALSDDLIFSYYVEGCMEGCMRNYIIRYFPLTPGAKLIAYFDTQFAMINKGCASHGR